MSIKSPSTQKGVSLLEVMVAVLILSFGMLGLAAMQTNALRNNQSSFQKNQAIMLSYFMIDAIRLDRTSSGSYAMTKTCTVPSSASGVIATNKKLWLQHIQDNLGANGCGEVSCNANNCTVRIYWNDERGTGGSSSAVLETNTRI